jgi:cytochrome P450
MAVGDDPLPLTSVEERARDPHAYFRARRAEGPVQWLAQPGSPEGTAVVVAGDAVYRALHDNAYTARGSVSYGRTRPIIPTHVDPPEHTRYRRFLDPPMKHSEMVKLEPHIAARANRLIDGFSDRGGCEFHTEFAIPLPGTTFLHLFGMPEEDLDFLVAFKDSVMKPTGTTPEKQRADQEDWARRAEEYFAELIARTRREGGDHLLGRLVRAEVNGDRLGTDELVDICFQLTLGGLDTVTATLGLMWTFLAQHAGHRALINADPAAMIGIAVEELLRWATPVTAVKRRTTRDTDVAGCPLPAGQPVLLSIFSANADPARFPAPDIVDFARTPNKHNAFGGGIHRCLGSHLARVELATALREWHRRIPDYEIVPGEEPGYSDASAIRMVCPLRLCWSSR